MPDADAQAWLNTVSGALRPFLEHNPAAVFLRDGEGYFVWANAAYTRLLCGSYEGGLQGRRLDEVLPRKYARLYRQLDEAVIEKGTPLYDSVPFPRQGGSGSALGFRFPVELVGHGRGVGGVYIDASELQEVRHRWAVADECFRAVFDHALSPMAMLDIRGRITDANPAFCSLFGLSCSALRQRRLTDLVDFEAETPAGDPWQQLINGGRSRLQVDVSGLQEDGARFTARMTTTLVRRLDGTPSRAACTLGGITAAVPETPKLTPTELSLLLALAAGATNAELQRSVLLARQTVDYHLAKLRTILGADSRAALVARAYATGVLLPGCWPPRASAGVQTCDRPEGRSTTRA
ncbi:PAS domain-containing protein [Streptomyces sp. R11]|uniref:PAS domain-containing protein n=1 Tax=Streptomyces sp. R11 TaxID=3238625 RepID=A0AB39NCI9_9ACTN